MSETGCARARCWRGNHGNVRGGVWLRAGLTRSQDISSYPSSVSAGTQISEQASDRHSSSSEDSSDSGRTEEGGVVSVGVANSSEHSTVTHVSESSEKGSNSLDSPLQDNRHRDLSSLPVEESTTMGQLLSSADSTSANGEPTIIEEAMIGHTQSISTSVYGRTSICNTPAYEHSATAFVGGCAANTPACTRTTSAYGWSTSVGQPQPSMGRDENFIPLHCFESHQPTSESYPTQADHVSSSVTPPGAAAEEQNHRPPDFSEPLTNRDDLRCPSPVVAQPPAGTITPASENHPPRSHSVKNTPNPGDIPSTPPDSSMVNLSDLFSSMSVDSDHTHLPMDPDPTHQSPMATSHTHSVVEDHAHFYVDSDPTHLSVFEVRDSRISTGVRGQDHTSSSTTCEEDCSDKRDSESSKGQGAETDSDATDLSIYEIEGPNHVSGCGEGVVGGRGLDSTTDANTCQVENFKPSSFSTPFRANVYSKGDLSESGRTSSHSDSTRMEWYSDNHHSTGSTRMECISDRNLNSTCADPSSSGMECNTMLSPDAPSRFDSSIWNQFNSHHYDSVRTPPKAQPIPASAKKSILKNRQNTSFACKNLSKSVTFKLPFDSPSIHTDSSSCVLATETPEHLWCTIPRLQGPGLTESDTQNLPRIQTSLVDADNITIVTAVSPGESSVILENAVLLDNVQLQLFQSDDSSCRMSPGFPTVLTQAAAACSMQESELEPMSILATATPMDMWNTPEINFIDNTFQ